MDAVTEVLIDRTHQADRLSQMIVLSLVAHGVLLSVVTLSGRLFPSHAPVDEHPLVISLAGAPGPVQGHNPMSPKPVEQVTPDKPKVDTPPPLPRPELTESVKPARPEPKTPPKPEPKKTEPQLHGRTPTQGPEIRQGTSRVDTGQTAPI